jgi:hypothetical protein
MNPELLPVVMLFVSQIGTIVLLGALSIVMEL